MRWCLARQARSPGWRPPLFSVNLSDVSIANPGFARAELARPGFPARAICFEFVESDETLNALHTLGIDYAQGFGIARPQPIDAIRD